MRRRTAPTANLGRLLPVCFLLVATSLCVGGGVARKSGVRIKLTKVQETRKVKLAAFKDDGSFDFNKPGLELTFSIEAPNGKQIIRLDQPTSIVSTDSVGRNLADVKPNFMNRKEYVKLIQVWQKPAEAFTLTLASPGRSATRFSVAARFEAWAFDDLKETMFAPGSQRMTVDPKLFSGSKVTAELTESKGRVSLVLIPGTIKPYIAEIELIDGDTTHQTNGSMWNDGSVTYLFNTSMKPGMKVRIKARTGMEKFDCIINIKDQLLP